MYYEIICSYTLKITFFLIFDQLNSNSNIGQLFTYCTGPNGLFIDYQNFLVFPFLTICGFPRPQSLYCSFQILFTGTVPLIKVLFTGTVPVEPTGQAVRVMVHTVELFPWSHHMLSFLRLAQVRSGLGPTGQTVRVMVTHVPLGGWFE